MSAASVPTARAEPPGCGLVLNEPSDDSHALSRAYVRYLAACCRQFLTVESRLDPVLRPAHARVTMLVREALAQSQRQMLNCFASPTVGTPLQCLELRGDLELFRSRIDQGGKGLLPHLLLEMALRKLIPVGQSVLWEHGAPRLSSIALGGVLNPPAGATGLRFSSSHLAAICGGSELGRLPLEGAALPRALADEGLADEALADEGLGFRLERRFRRIGQVTHFATIDHNPIAAFEAHPDKAGNHIDLGGHPEDEWVRTLDDAFALVGSFLPGELAEMRTMLHEVIPVGYDPERHLSASYREAVGTVYLTLHPNLMTMTEAVIHEFQHNKLNVSAYSVDYLSNAFSPLYRSPIRPDPRPLWGILLAVHAFLPVAELYRRMREGGHPLATRPDFTSRMSDIDLKNHEGMEMLRAHADFTEAGRALFADLERLERGHLADRTARGLETTPTEAHLA